MRRSVLAVLAAGALLAFPAAAEPFGSPSYERTARLSLAAYDLHSEDSVAALYQDITETAALLCARLNRDRADRNWCERSSIDRTVARASIASLSRYHEARLTAGEPATLAQR